MKRPGKLHIGLAVSVLLLLLAGALGGIRLYLSSNRVTQRVADRLQALLGGTVRVGKADIGLHGNSTLQNVEVFEGKGETGETPWLRADEIEADLSLLSLLRGETVPDRITLSKPRLVLRSDKDNHLLTRLPTGHGAATTFPQVHIDHGAITLDQEDRSPLIVEGITADASAQGMVFQVNGTIADPSWGNWTAKGSFDSSKESPTSGDVALNLDTPHADVTMVKLRSLPFVSKKVWKAVQAEGATPVHFALAFNTARKGVHYHIDMTPHDTRVDVPAIDLHANQASGRLIIDDYVVDLQGVHGRTAGGAIATDAHLDFKGKTDRLAFKVQVSEVQLQKLPRSWKLPRVQGDLTGKADLVVTIDEKSKVRTRGAGDGEIMNFRWGVVQSNKPVPVHLRAEGDDFHWGGLPAPSARLPAERGGPRIEDRGSRIEDRKAGGRNPRSSILDPRSLVSAVSLVAVAPPEPEAGTDVAGPILSLIGQLPRGVSRMTRAITDGASTALRRAAALAKPAPAPTAPRARTDYLDASFSLEDIDLTQLIKQVGVRFPMSITGRLSFAMQVAIPVDTPKDLRAYRLRGTATMRHLNVSGLEAATLRAHVHYADGVLELRQVHGAMAPLAVVRKRAGAGFAAGPSAARLAPEAGGTFDGHARYGVVPEGDFDADLTLERIPLGTVLNGMPDLARQVRGAVAGKFRAHAPAGHFQDPAAWRASGSLRSALLEAYGMRLKDAVVDLNLDRGVATLTGLKGDLQGTPLTGLAELRVTRDYPYKGRLSVAKFNLALLEQIAPQFRPPFPVKGVAGFNGDLRGTLRPFTIKTNGKARASDLVVNGVRVDTLSFDVAEDPKGIRLTHIAARLYRGAVTGVAILPVEKREAGAVNLDLEGVDVGALSKSLPKFPVPLEGRVSGTVKGEVTPATRNRPGGVTTQITIKEARQLRVRGIPAQRLHGYVDYHNGAADYRLEGEVFGGRFKLQGKYPSAEPGGGREEQRAPAQDRRDEPGGSQGAPAAAEGPPDGRLELEGARLSRVWEALHLENRLGPLSGRFSLNLPFRFVGPERRFEGDGSFQIGSLRWSDVPVAGRLEGVLLLRPDSLEVRNLSGAVAGGSFRAGFYFNLRQRRANRFTITLEQADAGRALAPFPAVARQIEGVLGVHLRGWIGPEWTGGGRVELTRGRVFGLSVTEWHFPLDFAFAPAEGRGEVAIRDSGARVGGGQALARANLRWDEGLSLDGGDLRFFNVDMRTLLSELGHYGSLAAGRMSGRLEFSGSDMHSVDDLRALLYASFSQTQALQLPVLSQLAPFLGGTTSNTTFQSGELRARLANGVLRIQRFGLHGNILQLFLGGNVTLAGRLNLDVNVRAGGLQQNGPLLALLGLRLPLVGPVPVAVLARATVLLANQVVHLHVVGTIRNPYVQVERRRLLSDEAARFFLLAAPFPGP